MRGEEVQREKDREKEYGGRGVGGKGSWREGENSKKNPNFILPISTALILTLTATYFK